MKSFASSDPKSAPTGAGFSSLAVFLLIAVVSLPAFATQNGAPKVIAQTGQTGCWNEFGQTSDCTGTGQDGEIQSGVPWPVPRFRDNISAPRPVPRSGDITPADPNDLTVTDRLTGLIWSKDANPAGIMTWQQALDYIRSLNNSYYLGHDDWRLPNRNELRSLATISHQGGWLNAQGVINLQQQYWSSTTSADFFTEYASTGIDAKIWDKTLSCGVWPVRAGHSGALTLPATGQTSCWSTA